MAKKIIGGSLIIIGGFIALVLFYSGTIFPHIIGPIVFVASGAYLFLAKPKLK